MIDETGHTYGRLTAIESVPDRHPKHWLCRCTCGRTKVVSGNKLRSGWTRSCGCYRTEVTRLRCTTHGESRRSREYQAWGSMIRRCETPSARERPNYAGRGITVCARWRESYPAFLADMGRCPMNHSLDRIDNDGPYAPENCRWATHSQQVTNSRHVRHVTLDGERITVAQMAQHLAIDPKALWKRLRRLERSV